MKSFILKDAFTLAEMLISLTLIGVIAALTVPAVMQDTETRTNAVLLRKAMAKLDTVVEMAQSESTFQPFNCYYDRTSGNTKSTNGGVFSNCALFRNYLINNLKTIKTCPPNGDCLPDYNGIDTAYGSSNPKSDDETQEQYDERIAENLEGCENFSKASLNSLPAFVTNDGMIFINYSDESPIYAVDVNGKKGPNRFGHDVFFFTLKGASGFAPAFAPGGCEFVESGGMTTEGLLNSKY